MGDSYNAKEDLKQLKSESKFVWLDACNHSQQRNSCKHLFVIFIEYAYL